MRVCVPSMGNQGMDEQVGAHFGRSPTYTIVDLDTDEVRVIQNVSEHMGGAGKPPEHLVQEGVEVMLCSNLGPRAIRMFESHGIEVYVGASGTVRNAIDMYKSRQLMMATDENACKEHRHH